MPDVFISHSSQDNEFVEKLISKLGGYDIWYDKQSLETGHLPQQLSENIIGAKWFLFIASKNSVNSKWVKYELNIAVTHWIEEEQNFKILVIKIDDCKIPPTLYSAFRIGFPKLEDPDEIIEETIAIVTGKKSIPESKKGEWRKKIVDRFEEIAAIEDAINERSKFIVLFGNYGIGKTTVVMHAVRKIFEREPVHIRLTKSHDELVLALQLSAKAGLKMPESNAGSEELLNLSIKSLVELNKRQKVIFFDDLDQIIEDGVPDDFFITFMREISQKEDLLPILISTSWYPSFPDELKPLISFHRVGPLSEKHILYCLENWIKIADTSASLPDQASLKKISHQLHGYPLAARFASFLIAKYGVELVLKDTSHFKELRTSIAKQLFGRIRSYLSDLDVKCLLFLTVADTGLTMWQMEELLGAHIKDLRDSIERLFSALLLYYAEERYQIIPMVKDYFWRVAHERGLIKEIAIKLARQAHHTMTQNSISKEDYVIYAVRAYRLYMLAGRDDIAKSLKYRFRESIREVVKRYYHSSDYVSALKYANLYLELGGSHLKMRWYKARCLTRLGEYAEAIKELKLLEKRKYSKYMVEFAWGLLYRDKKDFSRAIIHFKRGLDEKPDYLPLLRELGHAYLCIGDKERAFNIIEEAYELEPRDVYITLKYAEILQEMGRDKEAMDIISSATAAFPDEPGYHLRYSKMLRDNGEEDLSYEHASKAVKLDGNYIDAILHLASLEVRRKHLETAENLLKRLPNRLSYDHRLIKATVEAEIASRKKDFERARNIIRPFKDSKDPYVMDVLARIELYDAYSENRSGNIQLAKERMKKSKEIIQKATTMFPHNVSLQQTQQKILALEKHLNS